MLDRRRTHFHERPSGQHLIRGRAIEGACRSSAAELDGQDGRGEGEREEHSSTIAVSASVFGPRVPWASLARAVSQIFTGADRDLLTQCQELRYRVYHRDLGLDMPDLDHVAKVDVEDRDPHSDFAAVLDGRPVVLATHDPRLHALATRIVTLEDGRVVDDRTTW